YYKQDFVQYADNGKTVGSLNGAASVNHVAAYKSADPSFSVRYLLRPDVSLYTQIAKGNEIPLTKVFDVTNAQVATVPKPTRTKTYQVGVIWQSERMMVRAAGYRIRFDNAYTGVLDPTTGDTNYYASGTELSKGAEAETNVVIGGGFSLYLNGTFGSATYQDS